ncbi:hypothetical protein GCM10010286_55210 [Streptomyces toxytricini]|nr:hypothetical protein GCM10010286_55210 [Streptomyces toxytricini]
MTVTPSARTCARPSEPAGRERVWGRGVGWFTGCSAAREVEPGSGLRPPGGNRYGERGGPKGSGRRRQRADRTFWDQMPEAMRTR